MNITTLGRPGQYITRFIDMPRTSFGQRIFYGGNIDKHNINVDMFHKLYIVYDCTKYL